MANFSDLVMVVRHLTNRSMLAGMLSGDLHVDTPDILAALQACESDGYNTAVSLLEPSSISIVIVGSNVHVEIGTPRPGFGLIPENLDKLLCYQSAHVKEPSNYLLLDTNYCPADIGQPDQIITSYRAVLRFAAMLKSCAAFLNEQEEILFFIKDGKFEIPVTFVKDDLCFIDLETIEALSNAIPKDMHRKQCLAIMAEAVYEISAKFPPSKRFTSLLENVQGLKERFENGYKLFSSGFSYEKIRDEIEDARIEYSGKIHKVFSDIQNQLLGIPIATIIVATQMKTSKNIDSNFYISIAVLIGSFIFMLLMHFLLKNQRHTLEVIGIEIKRQKSKLENEHAAISEFFIDTFASLDNRYNNQKNILYAIDAIVVVGFLLSVFFFYILNEPIQKWLSSLVN